MEWYWIASTAITVISSWVYTYRMAFARGYRTGGTVVLQQWKDYVSEIEGDDQNE